jgi:single-strand DNA-binding protein
MCIARYTLAIDRRSKNSEDKTDFIRCVAFGKGGEFAEKYLHKGMRMLVSGSIQTDSYTDKDGKKVSTWEIVVASQDFADSKGDSTGSAPAPAQPQKSSENWMSIPTDADDEGLPFN